jgi:hypothetical protein
MPLCYFIPGYAGSELRDTPDGAETLWVNRTQLALGRVLELRLDADGVNPGEPDGKPLYLKGVLGEYYTQGLRDLTNALVPHDYTILSFPYDWRKSALTAGRKLALEIVSRVDPSEPCAIVAHSFGGLVTRVAWYELRRQGKEGLIRRIVTLGTPHDGSYHGVAYLLQKGQILDDLVWLYNLAPILGPIIGFMSKARIASMMATWPSLYESFPFLGTPQAADDPRRPGLFDATQWAGEVIPSQAWLNYAKNVWQPLMRDPLSQPPPWVLTTVAGLGQPTGYALDYLTAIQDWRQIQYDQRGDNSVHSLSALVDASTRYTVEGMHFDLLGLTAANGDLAEWVLEDRQKPPPAQLPAVVPAIADAGLVAQHHLLEPPVPGGFIVPTAITGG